MVLPVTTTKALNNILAQIQCPVGNDESTPVFVGRIICDVLLWAATSNETDSSWLKVWPSSETTATSTRNLMSLESFMPRPGVDLSSSLRPPAVVPTISAGSLNSNAPMNTGNYLSLNKAPPSPSSSDLYEHAHPRDVKVAVGPSPFLHHHQQLKTEKLLGCQIIPEEEEVVVVVAEQKKGKGREHPNPKTNNNNTMHWQSTPKTLNMVSSVLVANVKHPLVDLLLPGQHKRMVVLTSSESEDEHFDDDGSWSSEEMRSEDEEVHFRAYWIHIGHDPRYDPASYWHR